MKPADQLLRENVRKLQGNRTQRSLARAIGVSDTNMSEFLAGKQGLGLERLAPLAKELGTTVAQLFAPVMVGTKSDVQKGTDSDLSRQGLPVDSMSLVSGRGVNDGAKARVLEQRIAELEGIVRAQAIEADRISDELWAAVTGGRARRRVHRTGDGQSKSRKTATQTS